jgi:hypothetical protein
MSTSTLQMNEECSAEIEAPGGFSLLEDHACRLTSATFWPSASTVTVLARLDSSINIWSPTWCGVALGPGEWEYNLWRRCFEWQEIWKAISSPVLLLR